MSAPKIQYSDSLESAWGECVYTEARLLADPHAKQFAPAVSKQVAHIETAIADQRSKWRDEIRAQAHVDAANDELDDTTREISSEILHSAPGDSSKQKLKHPRYVRYFKKPAHAIIRLGLESQLGEVRTWAASLKSESEKVLQKLGVRLEGEIEKGDQVVAGRATAKSATADHRVRKIVPLVDELNTARLSLHGSLSKIAADEDLGGDWPDRFFQHSAGRTTAKEVVAPASPTPATGADATKS